MIQFIRVIVAILVVGFSSTYYLSGDLDLSNAPQLLTFDEFRTNSALVNQYFARASLGGEHSTTFDPQVAYSTYLNDWSATSPRTIVPRTFVAPIRDRLHRLYGQIAARLPKPRTEGRGPLLPFQESPLRSGMIATAIGLAGLVVAFQVLSSWLRSLARS